MGSNAYRKAVKSYDPYPGKTLSALIASVYENKI
jgi:hypothetical protein